MSQETKTRLLDAAERLFAEHGFRESSLRAITQEAGANLAAVNYHFGSKEGLIRAVLDHRLGPLNQERIDLLESLQANAAERALSVEQILYALIAPAFQLGDKRTPEFAAFMARLHFEQDEALIDLVLESFREVQQKFLQALQLALPDLSPRQLAYRFHFAIGAMAMVVVNRQVLLRAARGLIDSIETENVIQRLINFLAHGFRAPAISAESDHKIQQASEVAS
jgi:AcrR family transcriptional regulator